jgi:hypothetical protein
MLLNASTQNMPSRARRRPDSGLSRWHSSNTINPTSENASGAYESKARQCSGVITSILRNVVPTANRRSKSLDTSEPSSSAGKTSCRSTVSCSTRAWVGAMKITLFPLPSTLAILRQDTVVLPAPVGSTITADVPRKWNLFSTASRWFRHKNGAVVARWRSHLFQNSSSTPGGGSILVTAAWAVAS